MTPQVVSFRESRSVLKTQMCFTSPESIAARSELTDRQAGPSLRLGLPTTTEVSTSN